MPKKKPGPEPHQIIWAGDDAVAVLFNKKKLQVWIRELPARYHRHVFTCSKQPADIVELCAYVHAGDDFAAGPALEPATWPSASELRAQSRFPEIPPPQGYWPVPAGWADNLQPASLLKLYALAKKLNFSSAAITGKEMIAAAEWQGPLLLASEQTLLPFAQKLTGSLISSLTALSTSAAQAAASSSIKPSPG